MTLHRTRDGITFECFSCDETLETGTHDFDEAMAAYRQAMWHLENVADEWIHECPACKRTRRAQRGRR